MTRPYVTEVKFNIQGGGEYKLGRNTLIVGDNRIGKSSIVRAVELATTGCASDVAGRETLKLDAELWTLAGDGVEIVHAVAAFSDDRAMSEWTLTRGKKSKRSGPTAVFPLRDVKSALLGNADTARKFFLSKIARVTWDDVLREIPPQFHERLDRYKSLDGAAGLLAAIDLTKKRIREINAEAKALRSNASIQSQGLPPPAAPAEIDAAKAAASSARFAHRAAELDAAIEEVSKRVANTRARLGAAVDAVAATSSTASLPEIFTHAMKVMIHHVDQKSDACSICGTKVGLAEFVKRLSIAKAKIEGVLLAEQNRIKAESELREAKFDFGAVQADLFRLVEERKRIGDVSQAPSGDYETLVTTAAKWDAIRQSEGRAVQLETDATNLGQLVELATVAMERLIERSRTGFETRVQKYLPSSFIFGVDLKDGDRDVFRIGLRQVVGGWALSDGRGNTQIGETSALRTALSGAEWSAVTAALASAVSETIDADTPIIIVPEDRDYDPSTLAKVMQSFAAVDGQVIITATKRPDVMIDGWTVIDLNRGTGDIFHELRSR